MGQEIWGKIDSYFDESILKTDSVLEGILQSIVDTGLPEINVSPAQGRMLYIFARMMSAKSILEIGTLAGYSTVCLARALPDDGHMMSLELNPLHASIARENIRKAGLAEKVDVKEGAALSSLQDIYAEDKPSFDLVFIDADKKNNPEYFSWALRMSHPGTLIVVDNVVRRGTIMDTENDDPNTKGVRELVERISAQEGIQATAIQTVGIKGYDGFAMIYVE